MPGFYRMLLHRKREDPGRDHAPEGLAVAEGVWVLAGARGERKKEARHEKYAGPGGRSAPRGFAIARVIERPPRWRIRRLRLRLGATARRQRLRSGRSVRTEAVAAPRFRCNNIRLLCRRHFDQSCEWTVFRLFLSNFKQLRRPALEHLMSVDWHCLAMALPQICPKKLAWKLGAFSSVWWRTLTTPAPLGGRT